MRGSPCAPGNTTIEDGGKQKTALSSGLQGKSRARSPPQEQRLQHLQPKRRTHAMKAASDHSGKSQLGSGCHGAGERLA